MSIATNYFENLVLNPLRGTPATAPAAVYLGLFLTSPGESGAGTEVSGGAYARQAVTFGTPVESSAGVQSIYNNASITFPTATQAWGTITYVALLDALTGGNMLAYIQLQTPKNAIVGSTISFIAGELRVDATAQFTTYYKQAALNLIRGTSISAITNVYLSAHTADPGEGGGFSNEVVASPYVRQAVVFGAPAEQGNGNMQMSNNADVNFPQVGSVGWGTIAYIGLCDALSGGNMLLRAAASPNVTLADGDRLTLAVGTFTVFAA